MVYYETDSRLQFAREHAERLADDMRRSRPLVPEAAHPAKAKFSTALAAGFDRLRRRKGYHAPAYHA
jgi:hypothetical protein